MDKDERIIDVTSEKEEVSSEDGDVVVLKNDTRKKQENKKQAYVAVYDLISVVMSSFVIIALLFTFAFRLVGVKGSSMTNTLNDGDWLLTYQKESYVHGDIVVITGPNDFNEPLIKRVIATGGETVNIDYSTSTVYVNGKAIDEPYIRDNFILQNLDDIKFPYTVPEGFLFCMGDNRNGSTDSRSNLIGPIDERYVLGKAFVRVLPLGDFNIYDYE